MSVVSAAERALPLTWRILWTSVTGYEYSSGIQERMVRDDVERERNRLDRDPFHHDGPINTGNDHSYKEKSLAGKSQEQEYGEVRIMADEISAITENSDF